jgi:DNA-nicking Smr family endonuclease
MKQRLKHLGDLAPLKQTLAERVQRKAADDRRAAHLAHQKHEAEHDFRTAVGAVEPLRHARRHVPAPVPVAPVPHQRIADDRAVLDASVSDEIDLEALLDTDDTLSWRRQGTGPDVLRKLRRGEWTVQAESDLHGFRVDAARGVVAEFLRDAIRRGLRCVRIIHGKGNGSKDRQPVLKGKVRGWLIQREEVIAFCQARPTQGGAGALMVLLRPSTPAPSDRAAR